MIIGERDRIDEMHRKGRGGYGERHSPSCYREAEGRMIELE